MLPQSIAKDAQTNFFRWISEEEAQSNGVYLAGDKYHYLLTDFNNKLIITFVIYHPEFIGIYLRNLKNETQNVKVTYEEIKNLRNNFIQIANKHQNCSYIWEQHSLRSCKDRLYEMII